MSVEQGSYRDFSSLFHAKVSGARVPANVTLEITHRCPLKCQHCLNNLPMNDVEARNREMDLADYRRVIDQLADAGSFWILFTGGEIFARSDFLEIYTYAKQKGMIITLFTNGTMISPRIADHLREYRPFSIEITLYGRTRETYEALTRIPGSYDACLRGIRLLKERGLPLRVKTVAVSINKHEIWEMKRFVEEELELPFKFDAMLTPRIDCSQSPLATRLTPEEIVDLDLTDPRRMEDWQKFSGFFLSPPQPSGQETNLYHCGGGINSFGVDPAGQMSICSISMNDKFDLRAATVEEGWEKFLRPIRERKAARVTKCTACHLKAACGMCPATAELENGDAEMPVEFLCHVAHLRAEVFGWSVPPHGACEFCEGGSERSRVLAGAADLRRRQEGRGERQKRSLSMLPSLGAVAQPASCDPGSECEAPREP